MVLIEGHQGVHLLLDLILNEASSYQPAPGHFFLGPGGAMGIGLGGGGVSDLPLILAPTPFHGASVHKPQVRLRSSSSFFISSSNSLGSTNLMAANLPRQASSLLDLERQALEGQEDDQGPLRDEGGLRMRRGGEGLGRGLNGSVNEVWSGLEVTGPLPPWTLHRLLRVLQEEGGEEGGGSRGLQDKRLKRQVFQMRMESEASCINLNCLPLQRRQGEVGEEDRGVGGAEMERDDGAAEERAIKDEGALIHRRFVKGITSKGDGGLIMNL